MREFLNKIIGKLSSSNCNSSSHPDTQRFNIKGRCKNILRGGVHVQNQIFLVNRKSISVVLKAPLDQKVTNLDKKSTEMMSLSINFVFVLILFNSLGLGPKISIHPVHFEGNKHKALILLSLIP